MKEIIVKIILVFFGLTAAIAPAQAQQTTTNRPVTREEYIATFAPIAIQHQQLYGIPASIKMAQGIIESRYGNSELSCKSNNHFGIKCKSYWTGNTIKYDDDEAGECFRCYDSAVDSYLDHSEFLKSGQRYAFLFDLKPTDYKGWAHGLKKAGYATAPTYATSLIKCIEDYELYLLDEGVYPSYLTGVQPVASMMVATQYKIPAQTIDIEHYVVSAFTVGGYGVFYKEGCRYVVAKEGESYKTLARKLGLSQKRLLKYNGKDKNAVLTTGEKVFIERLDRKKKA